MTTKERLADREDQILKLNQKIEAMIKQNSEELQRVKTEYSYRYACDNQGKNS